jgi:hypothetical protein
MFISRVMIITDNIMLNIIGFLTLFNIHVRNSSLNVRFSLLFLTLFNVFSDTGY